MPIVIGPGIAVGGGITVSKEPPTLVIPLNDQGGVTGWSSTSAGIPYSATVIADFPVGSTIRFQDNTTSTISMWDDYGPTYIDIFWVTPKTGTIFPITLIAPS
jgi:hypothetical protein